MIRLRIAAAISSTSALASPFAPLVTVSFGIRSGSSAVPELPPQSRLSNRRSLHSTVSGAPDSLDWIHDEQSRIQKEPPVTAIDISVPVFKGMLHPGRQPEQ